MVIQEFCNVIRSNWGETQYTFTVKMVYCSLWSSYLSLIEYVKYGKFFSIWRQQNISLFEQDRTPFVLRGNINPPSCDIHKVCIYTIHYPLSKATTVSRLVIIKQIWFSKYERTTLIWRSIVWPWACDPKSNRDNLLFKVELVWQSSSKWS